MGQGVSLQKAITFVLKFVKMKKWILAAFFGVTILRASLNTLSAQCSICTKTAQQLGEKPARGMNTGILYLAFAPFAIVGYISYRWWKNNRPSG